MSENGTTLEVTAHDEARDLFDRMHQFAHDDLDEWTSTTSTTTHPGEAKASVTCDVCGFAVGFAMRIGGTS